MQLLMILCCNIYWSVYISSLIFGEEFDVNNMEEWLRKVPPVNIYYQQFHAAWGAGRQ